MAEDEDAHGDQEHALHRVGDGVRHGVDGVEAVEGHLAEHHRGEKKKRSENHRGGKRAGQFGAGERKRAIEGRAGGGVLARGALLILYSVQSSWVY